MEYLGHCMQKETAHLLSRVLVMMAMPQPCLYTCLRGVPQMDSSYSWLVWARGELPSVHEWLRCIDIRMLGTNVLLRTWPCECAGLFCLSLSCSDGRFVFGRSYSNEQLTVSLDNCPSCRAGLTIRDLERFTIWCRVFDIFFTSLDIPADLFDVSETHMM